MDDDTTSQQAQANVAETQARAELARAHARLMNAQAAAIEQKLDA